MSREFRVSRVTIWRWISEGRLPAYRLGSRAVRIRRQDLASIVAPYDEGHQRRRDQLSVLRELDRVRTSIQRRRGGRPLGDPVEHLARARDERDADL